MLLLGGLELALISGIFTVLDFHEVNLSLVWLADLGPGCAGWY